MRVEPRRRVLRLLTGSAALCIGAALYALAFPPFDHAWSAWLALVPLLLTVRGLRSRGAFLYGAAYGLAWAFAMGSTGFPRRWHASSSCRSSSRCWAR